MFLFMLYQNGYCFSFSDSVFVQAVFEWLLYLKYGDCYVSITAILRMLLYL